MKRTAQLLHLPGQQIDLGGAVLAVQRCGRRPGSLRRQSVRIVPTIIGKPPNVLPAMLSGIGIVSEHGPEGQFTGPLLRNAMGRKPADQRLGRPLLPGRYHAGGDVKQLRLRNQPVRGSVPL